MCLMRKLKLRSFCVGKCRRFRSINLPCLIVFFAGAFILLILIIFLTVIHQVIIYVYFVYTYPFPAVPFWKDNRTFSSRSLLSRIESNQVNLSNSTIVIAACCRNVEKSLIQFQKNVHKISQLFRDYRIYLCESDSTDRTLKFLNEWNSNDSEHVRVYSYGRQHFFSYRRKQCSPFLSSYMSLL